jgi:hypothetical protein
MPKIIIFLANTILNNIKSNSIEKTYSSSKKINYKTFEVIDPETKFQDIAIDFHDVPYYGDIETPYL